MADAKPYTKAQQLGRGPRRYRRKVASPKQWQAIIQAKGTPCRVCDANVVTFHHVVPRDFHGDDVAENIVPLCDRCHGLVTSRYPDACRTLCASLSDAEYAYAVEKAGEDVFSRVYGITYGRSE